ncbi:MAG: bifunctional diguanylate cyclase/phosphodiesterase [Pseudomonadota bacterium]
MADVSEILTSIGQASYVWDIREDHLEWSPNFRDLVGFRPDTVVSSAREFEKLLSVDSQETRYAVIQIGQDEQIDETGRAYQCVYAVSPNHLNDNEILWLEDIGRWYPDENGKPAHAKGVVRIINERRKREESLKRKSEVDELTGLANRRLLEDRINQTAEQCFLDNTSSAFLLVALQDFERINNTYGFAAGDEVLKQVTQLLKEQMRSDDIAARFSGAKFGLIIKDCKGAEIHVAANRLLTAINGRVLKTSQGPVALKIAIGACLLPHHARKDVEAVACATAALTRARLVFGRKVHLYDPDPEMIRKREQESKLLTRFVEVMEKDAMHLAFQPVFDPATGKPAFHEALLRMDGIGEEVTRDAEFVRVAEDLGLMRILDLKSLEMGLHVLETCPDAVLSINTTHESLENGEWISTLVGRIHETRGVADRLIIELTESHLPGDIAETRKAVRHLQNLGCRVAIDDFGTGYTSFAHLRDLGVDLIKVDGSFVRNLRENPANGVFLKAIQQLASAFDVRTVVEWVEDVETAVELQEWGFDYLQGSLYGMPLAVSPWEQVTAGIPINSDSQTNSG